MIQVPWNCGILCTYEMGVVFNPTLLPGKLNLICLSAAICDLQRVMQIITPSL